MAKMLINFSQKNSEFLKEVRNRYGINSTKFLNNVLDSLNSNNNNKNKIEDDKSRIEYKKESIKNIADEVKKIQKITKAEENKTTPLENIKQEFRIRLNKKEVDFLKAEAEKNLFSSIPKEIKYRVLNSIYEEKTMSNIELKKMNEMKNDLNKISTNLNELLKVLRKVEKEEQKISGVNYKALITWSEKISKTMNEIKDEYFRQLEKLEYKL